MSPAFEITSFRLATGLTAEHFIDANADINAWIRKQPGFIARHICESEDGSVVDIVQWETAEDGNRSAAVIMTEMAHSPVHATIEQRSVDWAISTVRQAIHG